MHGNYRGKTYDSIKKYGTFLCDTLYAKIKSVGIRVISKMGECSWPYIIPLTVEPSKPRLCYDDRFLNLLVKEIPFYLKDVHRLVNEGTYMVTTDENSGYDHVRLSVESQKYFGIQFGGNVMVYTVNLHIPNKRHGSNVFPKDFTSGDSAVH